MLEATVRNYRYIREADLVIPSVCLLQGQNQSGKSSLIWGIRSTVLGEAAPDPRYLPVKWIKAQYKELVNKAGACFVQVIGPGGGHHMVWPDATYTTKGQPPKMSKVAAGLWEASIGNMDLNKRKTALSDLLTADTPALEVFIKAIPEISKKEIIEEIRKTVVNLGWEPALRRATDRATDLRRTWEQITGDNFGSAKILTWRPPGWDDSMEPLTPEMCQEALEAAAGAHRSVSGGVETGRLPMLKASAGGLPGFQSALRLASEEVAKRTDMVAAQEGIVAALPPSNEGINQSCPHCGADVMILDGNLHDPEVMKISSADLKERRLIRATAEGKLGKMRQDLAQAKTAETLAFRDVDTAVAAQKELEKMGDVNTTTLAEAQERLDRAATTQKMVNVKTNAGKAAAQVTRTLAIVRELQPSGIRAAVLKENLDGLRFKLAQISKQYEMPMIKIDDNFDIWCGEELYRNISDSQQWRTRIIFQIAISEIDGSELMLIDNDVDMDKQWVIRLVQVLVNRAIESHMHAIVSIRFDKIDDAFKTEQSTQEQIRENVTSYWLADGTAKRFSSAGTEA